jgi:SAM-dependent methyltransferase
MNDKSNEPQRRREAFDSVAELYDIYRPGYPPEVITDVLRSTNIETGSYVLEIGSGTGQLSVPLAEHGVELAAVELGPSLAAIARRNLSGFPKAHVDVAAFDDWPLPSRTFDAVICAAAFHWLDPELRFSKSAQALRPGGILAIGQHSSCRGWDRGVLRRQSAVLLEVGTQYRPRLPALHGSSERVPGD